MMDVVDFAVKVTAAVLRRLADGIDAAEKPAVTPDVHIHIDVKALDEAVQKTRLQLAQQALTFNRR